MEKDEAAQVYLFKSSCLMYLFGKLAADAPDGRFGKNWLKRLPEAMPAEQVFCRYNCDCPELMPSNC